VQTAQITPSRVACSVNTEAPWQHMLNKTGASHSKGQNADLTTGLATIN